jgi:hypothetical protein
VGPDVVGVIGGAVPVPPVDAVVGGRDPGAPRAVEIDVAEIVPREAAVRVVDGERVEERSAGRVEDVDPVFELHAHAVDPPRGRLRE